MPTSSSRGKCSKIRHIVCLHHILLLWRAKAWLRSSSPIDVPSGHVAVRVGPDRRRFVLRAAYLNHPIFRNLLAQAEEEFGFDVPGPITIPCDVAHFEGAIQFIARSESSSGLGWEQRFCHVGYKGGWAGTGAGEGEGRPLLQVFGR